MGKSQQRAVQRKQRSEVRPTKEHVPRSLTENPCDTQNEKVLLQQLEAIFACLPDSVIVCEQDGKILRLNAAALELFEVPSEAQWRGKDYQEFFAYYMLSAKQQQPLVPEPWPRHPSSIEELTSNLTNKVLMLQVPCGREIAVNLSCSPLQDTDKHAIGMVFVFHELQPDQQEALHLQHVHEAVLTLTEAIAHLPERFPEQIVNALPEGSLLLSPPVVFIAQQLVDVIRHVLDCPRVSLKALGPAGYYYYVAGSGFIGERKEPERETSGRHKLVEVYGEMPVARLFAKKEVILRGDRMNPPAGFDRFFSEKIMMIPLCFGQQLIGIL